ncbi:MAG: hypothetical protein ACLPJH_18045 [Myxococcaceae bacterium]
MLVVAAGCEPYIYKPDVVGPHGEHLIELACPTPDGCMELARQTCQGDYNIVTNGAVAPGTPEGGSKGTNLMVIQCENQPLSGTLKPDAG